MPLESILGILSFARHLSNKFAISMKIKVIWLKIEIHIIKLHRAATFWATGNGNGLSASFSATCVK